MEFMTVRQLRSSTAEAQRMIARSEEVVLTNRGKPFAVVCPIDGSRLDDELRAMRRARARVALEAVRRSAEQAGTSRLGKREVDALIRDARGRQTRDKA